MYVDLEENGRRDVLKRLREELPAPIAGAARKSRRAADSS